MELYHAIILGIVEGITEFLPISSTGHLIITAGLLNLDQTIEQKRQIDAFNIIIQGGAILAVLGVFWPRVRQMVLGLFGRSRIGLKLVLNLIVAFLPAAILGVLLDDWITSHLFYPFPVTIALFLGGVALLLIRRWQARFFRTESEPGSDGPLSFIVLEKLRWQHALFIGVLQCVAMWPGTSRSMMTIIGGMIVGLKPKEAAEFSFLLGLPTLGGACVYRGYKNFMVEETNMFEVLGPVEVVVGCVVAFVAAALAVKWLIAYLSNHGLALFGWYRIGLAGVLVVLLSTGTLRIAPDDAATADSVDQLDDSASPTAARSE